MNISFPLPLRRLARASRSRFVRNVAIMATGTASAQAISMAFAPAITRIYGPEAYGVWGTFTAVVTVLIPVAALAYPIAIVLPREDRGALGLMRVSVYLALMNAALTLLVLSLTGEWLTQALRLEAIGDYLLFLPAAMLLSACMQVWQQWFVRKKAFHYIARIGVTHSLALNSLKIGIGWFQPVAAVLIVLATLGHALHALLFAASYRRNYGLSSLTHLSPPDSVSTLAFRYRDFPLYRAPQDLLNAASHGIPVIMLAALFSPAAAGFYSVAKLVMGAPSILVGQSVSHVFYPKITEVIYSGTGYTRQIFKATAVLFLIGAGPFGLIIAFGPFLFGMIFGSEWIVAGEYARWLSPFFLLNFINKPSVAAVPALGIQRGLLIYEVLSTGTKLLGLFLGFYIYKSDLVAIALFSILGVTAYALMILWILLSSRSKEKDAKAGR